MTLFESLLLGIIQGLTEFIPVSSSGHLIIIRDIFGFLSANALSVDAILQFATVLAVAIYFWKDLWGVLKTFIRFVLRKSTERREVILFSALIFGTIPAVFFGLFLESYMETVFRSTSLVAGALIFGSILMYFAEKLAQQNQILSLRKGIIIGFFQCLALIPGVSRSGSTISGGLYLGLNRADATRFSFLLSFPIIFGSGIKKFLDLSSTNIADSFGIYLLLSFFVAFFIGLLSIHFLIKYLKNHSLNVFVWYRIILASLIFLLL